MENIIRIKLEDCLPWVFEGSLQDSILTVARQWVYAAPIEDSFEGSFWNVLEQIQKDYEVKDGIKNLFIENEKSSLSLNSLGHEIIEEACLRTMNSWLLNEVIDYIENTEYFIEWQDESSQPCGVVLADSFCVNKSLFSHFDSVNDYVIWLLHGEWVPQVGFYTSPVFIRALLINYLSEKKFLGKKLSGFESLP